MRVTRHGIKLGSALVRLLEPDFLGLDTQAHGELSPGGKSWALLAGLDATDRCVCNATKFSQVPLAEDLFLPPFPECSHSVRMIAEQ